MPNITHGVGLTSVARFLTALSSTNSQCHPKNTTGARSDLQAGGWSCGVRGRAMPYLYKVVLGVTGAEGSSEEDVEPLGGALSPQELVVLL